MTLGFLYETMRDATARALKPFYSPTITMATFLLAVGCGMLSLVAPGIAQAQSPGEIDPSFSNNYCVNGEVKRIIALPDDKAYLLGTFKSVRGGLRNGIARINGDGTLDDGFNSAAEGYHLWDFALQSDGKLVVVGSFSDFGGTPRNRIVRLHADGSIDHDFDPGTGANDTIEGVFLLSTGKIIVTGQFTQFDGEPRNHIARLNADGSLDESFELGSGPDNIVHAVAEQSDGKLILGGKFTSYNGNSAKYLIRVTGDGTYDPSFDPGTGPSNVVHALAIQPDGKIVVGGLFGIFNGQPSSSLARVDQSGALDPNFDPGEGANSKITSIIVYPEGKLLVQGSFSKYGEVYRRGIARVNADGSFDSSLGDTVVKHYPSTNDGTIAAIALRTDGKIFVGGSFNRYRSRGISNIALLKSGGALSEEFIPDEGAAGGIVHEVIEDSNGDLIVGGNFNVYRGLTRKGVARLKSDGSPDPTFDEGIVSNGMVTQMLLQQDRKILIGGSFLTNTSVSPRYFTRLNQDGSIDSNFNPGGVGPDRAVRAVALQRDGKSLIGGDFTKYNGTNTKHIARIHEDGSIDESFDIGTGFDGNVEAIAVLQDGKILVGGDFITYNGIIRPGIAKLNPDGSLDEDFPDGSFEGAINAFIIQGDGKVILIGDIWTKPEFSANYIIRLNQDGTRDLEFNEPAGRYSALIGAASFNDASVQADGKIVVAGNFTEVGGVYYDGIARLHSDGSLDMDYPPQSILTSSSDFYTSVTIQSDGRVLAGGLFNMFEPAGYVSPFRFLNNDAVQNLSLIDKSRVQWQRTGATIELSWVDFEASVDGENWFPLGQGSRVGSAWEATDFELEGAGYIRALGRTAGRASSLVEQVIPYHFPTAVVFDKNSLASYDYVMEPGDRHQFDLSLNEAKVVKFEMRGTVPLRAELKDAKGKVIATTQGGHNITISTALRAGGYRLEVFRLADGGVPSPYSLTIDSKKSAQVRPDVALGEKPNKLTGLKVYAPKKQIVTLTSVKAKRVVGHIHIANHGDLADAIVVKGARGNKFLKVVWRAGSKNITAETISGKYETKTLLSSTNPVALKAIVTPNKKQVRKIVDKRFKIIRKQINLPVQVKAKSMIRVSDKAVLRVRTKPGWLN